MTLNRQSLEKLVDERPNQGLFRIHRSIFTNEEIFELEMKHIFESNWVYLAHESQLPNNFDFITSFVGRQPVIINRGRDGSIGGFINSCKHRGAVVEQLSRGNKRAFMCPFHSWTYDSDGNLHSIGESETSGYSDNFCKKELGLTRLAKVESYRGFIFASLNPSVVPLGDYLGEAARCIDHIVDQDPNGNIRVLPGQQCYTFEGNWKLQAENGVDGYHVDTIHGNYVQTIANRQQLNTGKEKSKTVHVGGLDKQPGGFYTFENGHVLLWTEWANPSVRPAYDCFDTYEKIYGTDRAAWMTSYLRNLFIYPNVFLMDQMSTQIRTFRPLAVDKTEVRTFCFGPETESTQARTRRIRQYEDFFNASGMATPDDLAAFNASQVGFNGRLVEWSDISRGAANLINGPDEHAKKIGLSPQTSGANMEDEGIFLNQHKHWLKTLTGGLEHDEKNLREDLNVY